MRGYERLQPYPKYLYGSLVPPWGHVQPRASSKNRRMYLINSLLPLPGGPCTSPRNGSSSHSRLVSRPSFSMPYSSSTRSLIRRRTVHCSSVGGACSLSSRTLANQSSIFFPYESTDKAEQPGVAFAKGSGRWLSCSRNFSTLSSFFRDLEIDHL